MLTFIKYNLEVFPRFDARIYRFSVGKATDFNTFPSFSQNAEETILCSLTDLVDSLLLMGWITKYLKEHISP